MATLFLIRHGQASYGAQNYDQLSPLGETQARKLGRYYAAYLPRPGAVISGTLQRQQDTFRLFAAGFGGELPSLQLDPAFNEHEANLAFEAFVPDFLQHHPEVKALLAQKGRKDPQVKKAMMKGFFRFHQAWVRGEVPADSRFEDWTRFRQRVEQGAQRLQTQLEQHQTVALFSSGGTIATLIGLALELSDLKMAELNWQIRNSSLSECSYSRGKWYLRGFNAVPHLRGSEAITYA